METADAIGSSIDSGGFGINIPPSFTDTLSGLVDLYGRVTDIRRTGNVPPNQYRTTNPYAETKPGAEYNGGTGPYKTVYNSPIAKIPMWFVWVLGGLLLVGVLGFFLRSRG